MSIKPCTLGLLSLFTLFTAQPVLAGEYEGYKSYDSYKPCPVGDFNQPYQMSNGTWVTDPAILNQDMNEEFGYAADGTSAQQMTHCLDHRKYAKVLVAINGAHPSDKNGNAQLDKARFLSNIEYMRENYEDVHGMKIGEDIKVIAVASNSGALLLTTHHPAWMRDKESATDPDCPMKPVAGKTCSNPFRSLVERAQEIGVKFYLCQMASRALGIKVANKIPGVMFVPGGHIAVADFQMSGYALIDL